MSVTWPYLAGLNYQKYGPTAGSPSTSIFYTPTNLTIAGNVASFDVTDGALGDSDLLADGTIIDPSGPILTILEVPTVNARNLALLALLMLLAATAVGYRTRWSGRR
ncbi:MAG: hypothetical protein EAZ30_00085 [Betaproteobacteria bacterium]|nr:MAG: hypothetical protein EAZ30_00085 [Betaproteobacteria bacterium]